MNQATTRLDREEELLRAQTIRLNATLMAVVVGLLFGATVFLATIWLVIQGGHVDETGHKVVGPHLQLLGQFFIGYKVSFLGSLIGFAYGAATGALAGWILGTVYNKVAALRS